MGFNTGGMTSPTRSRTLTGSCWRQIDADDERVVTVQRFTGHFRLTGIDVDFAWGAVISVSDGKIASAIGYPSPGLGKKAGGLTPPNTPSS